MSTLIGKLLIYMVCQLLLCPIEINFHKHILERIVSTAGHHLTDEFLVPSIDRRPNCSL